jgi:hypothetical protein
MIGLTPDVTAVSVVRHGVLHLTFADGLAGEADVLDCMRGPVFKQARTASGFPAVSVDAESGTVVWPGGADLAPPIAAASSPGASDRVRTPRDTKAGPRRNIAGDLLLAPKPRLAACGLAASGQADVGV